MYVDAVQRGDDIYSWVRFENGDLKSFKSPAPYYVYKNTDKDTGIVSIARDSVEKVSFNTFDEYKEFISKTPSHEADISPLYKFLSDTFHDKQNKNLNVMYFDIEVDFDLSEGIGYPTPENPYGEINSISAFDVKTQTYHMIVLNKDHHINLTDGEHGVIIHECVTERQLLDTFVRLIDDVDILSAWNGDDYDIPYILLRCMRIYGEREGIKKLCRDGFPAEMKTITDDYGNDVLNFTLVGRSHLDMMKVYKNSTFGDRQSYRLDFICEYETVGNKIPYTGDLGELYRTNPKKFFEYSLHDARLLYHLDRKMKIIELSILRAQSSCIRYIDVFGSIKPIEMKIRKYTHYEREVPMVLPTRAKDVHSEEFEGAYVLPTKAGMYGWTSSIDLGSLYPSVMRSLNISPEVHVLQCLDYRNDFVKVVERSTELVVVAHKETGKTFTLTGASLNDLIKEQGYTISANGSIFDNSVRGILAEVLDVWVAARESAKNMMFDYIDKKAEAKTEEEKQEIQDNIDFYNTKQLLAKLDNNSLYGAVSNKYCRFFTIDCAASITLTGQTIEKYQIATADQYLKERINEKA